MSRLLYFFLCTGIVACAPSTKEQPGHKPEEIADELVDSYIKSVMDTFQVRGAVAVGVVKDGKVVLEQAYGYRDYEKRRSASSSTPFYIASITKSFVGTLSAILHEKGSLSLDTQVSELLPFELPEEIDLTDVVLEDLLIHTSGIGNAVVPDKTNFKGAFTKEELFHDFESSSFQTSRGFDYSNLGYVIMGMIMEEELNESWKSLLSREVLEPLGMHNTSAMISTYHEDSIAKPHTYIDGNVKTGQFLKKDDTMHAAGGLMTTIEDMNRWMLFHLTNEPGLMTQKQLEKVHSDLIGFYEQKGSLNSFGYGLGWVRSDWQEYEVSSHGGGYSGYRSICVLSREEGVGVTIMMNQASGCMYLIMDWLLGQFLEIGDFEMYYEQQAHKYLNQWTRYHLLKDSIASNSIDDTELERAATAYAGTYIHEGLGELVVTNAFERLTLHMGNLYFETNFLGDDTFYYFSDGDQLVGTLDFYFLDGDNQASSIDFGGTTFNRIKTQLK